MGQIQSCEINYIEENNKVGADGMSAIQRRSRAMDDLKQLGFECYIAGRVKNSKIITEKDSPGVLRLLIKYNEEIVSVLFSPNAIVGGIAETQDKNGINKHLTYEEFIEYIQTLYQKK